jgi:hypothetical protein
MRRSKFIITIAVVLVFAQASVAALTAQGYRASAPITPGLAVSRVDGSGETAKEVELATETNKNRFAGIAVKQSEVTATTAEADSNVFVVNEGEVRGVVSDVSGKVSAGDNLVLSPLKGVLMKASAEETTAIATALESQNDENSTTETVSNRDNTSFEAQVSTILIDVSPKAIESSSEQKSFLVLFGNSLTGKEVSAVQVAAAFVIFLLVLIIEGSIIYGSIYSSIIALGRNPMSKGAVYRDLLQVVVLAIAILAAGVVAMYLVLWA